MAYITIEINSSNYSIGDLNAKTTNSDGTKSKEAVNALVDILSAIASGSSNATVKVVIKDSGSTINTSGSGSTSVTYNLA